MPAAGVTPFFMEVRGMKSIIAAVLLVLVAVPAMAQVTYKPVIIDMKPMAGGWVPATGSNPGLVRTVPVMVQSGTVTRVLLSRIPVASMVLFSADMFYESVKRNPGSFPETRAWMARHLFDVSPSGGSYVKRFEHISPTAGSDLDLCVESCKAGVFTGSGAIPIDEYYGFGNSAGLESWRTSMIYIDGQNPAGGQDCGWSTSVSQSCSTTCGAVPFYRYVGLYNWSPNTCEYGGKNLVGWRVPTTGDWTGQYTTVIHYGPEEPWTDIKKAMEQDLNKEVVPADAMKSLDELLKRFSEWLQQKSSELNRPGADGTTPLGEAGLAKISQGIPPETLTEMQTTGESAPGGEDQTDEYNKTNTTTGGGSGSGTGKPVCGAPPLPPCEVTGDWNDSQATPPDVSQTGLNETENSQVIGDQSAGVTEQRGILEAMFAELMVAVNSLVGRIMTEVNRWVGDQDGGTCSVGAVGVFGGTFSLDFCEIDLTSWRSVIIAFFGMLSAIILITGWRS